jgi:hypothetical protein
VQTTKLLTFLDELEAVGAEVASKLAPWLAPLLSAVVVGRAVTAAPFTWPAWLGWLTGAAIELSGIATLNTALLLWSYRTDQPADKKPSIVPLLLAVACGLAYLVTALALTVVLKILPGFEVLAYGLFVVLALTSAVNLTLRRDHVRRTTVQTKRPVSPRQTSRPKSASEPAKSSFVPGDLAALEAANAARFESVQQRREQVARMLSEGMSQPAIAQALGVSVSSIRRDKAALSNGRVEVQL